jgi:hypothetical protein
MPEILRNRSTPNPVRFTRSADRNATDARVQIEIPARCDAIRELLKVVDQGLKVKGPASRPVVIHGRTYHVPNRRPLPDRRDRHEVMEVAPRRREERRRAEDGDRRRDTVYVTGRGRRRMRKRDDNDGRSRVSR